eukprot:15580994-Heterocapsa_arctica.AAC.1
MEDTTTVAVRELLWSSTLLESTLTPSPPKAWKAMRFARGLSGFVGPEEVDGWEDTILTTVLLEERSTADNLRSGPLSGPNWLMVC